MNFIIYLQRIPALLILSGVLKMVQVALASDTLEDSLKIIFRTVRVCMRLRNF